MLVSGWAIEALKSVGHGVFIGNLYFGGRIWAPSNNTFTISNKTICSATVVPLNRLSAASPTQNRRGMIAAATPPCRCSPPASAAPPTSTRRSSFAAVSLQPFAAAYSPPHARCCLPTAHLPPHACSRLAVAPSPLRTCSASLPNLHSRSNICSRTLVSACLRVMIFAAARLQPSRRSTSARHLMPHHRTSARRTTIAVADSPRRRSPPARAAPPHISPQHAGSRRRLPASAVAPPHLQSPPHIRRRVRSTEIRATALWQSLAGAPPLTNR
jgi:hypothetical protein